MVYVWLKVVLHYLLHSVLYFCMVWTIYSAEFCWRRLNIGIFMRALLFLISFFSLILMSSAGLAGQPEPWQLGFQDPASPIASELYTFHELLLVIITAITVFVLGLLAYICVRFNEKANPNPSKTTHNTTIEVIWTVVPVLILGVIAYPSLAALTNITTIPEKSDVTIKVVGYQWYWGYEYPDHGISFDSNMIKDRTDLNGEPYLLAVDNKVVVPQGGVVKVQLTAADVIHAWAIPALGVRLDAIPGRLNETWFKATKTGVFYGQCSELCGRGHGFMPIAVQVVTPEEYEAWLVRAKEVYASASASVAVAALQ